MIHQPSRRPPAKIQDIEAWSTDRPQAPLHADGEVHQLRPDRAGHQPAAPEPQRLTGAKTRPGMGMTVSSTRFSRTGPRALFLTIKAEDDAPHQAFHPWPKNLPPTRFSPFLLRQSQHEVKQFIAGPSVFICDECMSSATTSSAKGPVQAQRAGELRSADPDRDRRLVARPVRHRPGSGQAHAVVAVYHRLQAPRRRLHQGRRVGSPKQHPADRPDRQRAGRCWRRRSRASLTCPS